jgi:hypothetical protein
MTRADAPEPSESLLPLPSVDSEAATLLYYLEGQRASVFSVLDGLPDAALHRAVFPSGWTCLGLVQHLAVDDERYWFRGIAAGEPVEVPAEDDSWLVEPGTAAEAVLDLYRDEIRRSNAIIEAMPLGTLARGYDPQWAEWGWPSADDVVNLRWIILHMIEETAQHAGHLDAARELLDGHTGPPATGPIRLIRPSGAAG